MVVGIALLSCLAILSELTFAEASISLDHHRDEATKSFEADNFEAVKDNARSDRSVDSVTKLLYPKQAFLAGEDTPVWIAYYADSNKVQLTYRKLEKGIVKQAIDYFKSDKFKGITRQKRSVDENMDLSMQELKEDREYRNTHSSISHLAKRLKREDNMKVFYPSVLAVMEYGKTWPSVKEDEQTLVLERIVYALAFWSSVDFQLTKIEDPRVRIRLAGIVIAQDRDATNTLYELRGRREYIHYEGTLSRLAQYWGDRMRRKIDFQRGTYNIVALMTDATEAPGKSTVGSFTDGPPCDHDNLGATGVLITSDDLEFSGLQGAVRATARMLGHGSDNNTACKYRSEWNSRAWNKCDLDSIRQSLVSNGWCMEEPMEFHDPGKPVETILPGMLISLERQCKAYGWAAGHVCKKWTCEALRCQEDYISLCYKRHPAMDGSECGVGMVRCDSEGNCYTDCVTQIVMPTNSDMSERRVR